MELKYHKLLDRIYENLNQNDSSIFDEQGTAFGRDINNHYGAHMVAPDDVEHLLKAIGKSGLKKEGVKVVQGAEDGYNYYVYTIVPKGMYAKESDPVNGIYLRIIEVLARPLRMFSVSEVPNKLKFKIIKDPYDTMAEEHPELEGIFNS